ncbi:MAG TPA: cyclic peptide export ABC transporter [Thermoanaerobaculia bacterium]|nr:cyclic peptide export ABC transporter [Thermoanaerobaculia bacterium]
MRFLNLLRREAGERGRLVAASTVLAGIAMGASMAVVNAVAGTAEEGLHFGLLILFGLLAVLYLATKKYALAQTGALVQDLVRRIRERIADDVRHTGLASLEHIGKARVSAVLSRDCYVISEAGERVVQGTISAFMLAFSAIYIATLSMFAFLMTVGAVFCAIFFYRRTQRTSREILVQSNEKETEFFAATEHLLDGFKEVKLSTDRSEDLYGNHVKQLAGLAADLRVAATMTFVRGANVSQMFFYLLLAMIVFILPQFGLESNVVIKITYIILFISGPIEMVVIALPVLAKANVAVENISQLETDLRNAGADADPPRHGAGGMSEIQCLGMTFSYVEKDGQQGFTVGPFNVTLRAGEVIFITGGNGSGKSTFLKLLTGLYAPSTGTLLWDGRAVGVTNLAAYRNLFSVIFSDFHLFDRLYGIPQPDQGRVDELLAAMKIDRKTAFRDGVFTNLDLSTGQRKRLAYVAARLEDRPIYVFDEWAADQDPSYRQYFYHSMIPTLRSEGKTVIVVTHDDRYFDIADRRLAMEEGRLEEITA